MLPNLGVWGFYDWQKIKFGATPVSHVTQQLFWFHYIYSGRGEFFPAIMRSLLKKICQVIAEWGKLTMATLLLLRDLYDALPQLRQVASTGSLLIVFFELLLFGLLVALCFIDMTDKTWAEMLLLNILVSPCCLSTSMWTYYVDIYKLEGSMISRYQCRKKS